MPNLTCGGVIAIGDLEGDEESTIVAVAIVAERTERWTVSDFRMTLLWLPPVQRRCGQRLWTVVKCRDLKIIRSHVVAECRNRNQNKCNPNPRADN